MTRPLALDLFCCAGGASMGLYRAGFDVIGVDIEPRPRYPFTFVQADALKPPFDLSRFDFIWASPPCQHATRGTLKARAEGREYPRLIEPTRAMLEASGVPYVIENVPLAAIRRDLVLRGRMFGLRVERERWFEIGGWWTMQPEPIRHPAGSTYTGAVVPVYSGRGFNKSTGQRQPVPTLQDMREAMGIDWMTRHELTQAIPPAYGEFIGRHALNYIQTAEAA